MNFWPQSCSQQLSPLKHACKLNPETLPETTDPEYEFEYIDIGNVTLEAGVGDRQTMTFGSAPSRARKPVQPGDILVSTVRTYLKAVAFIGLEADHWVASTGFAVLRPKQVLEPRYLYRVVQSNPFVEAVVAASTGVSYPAINPSTLGSINIPLPDLGTQKLIVAFLDREIARIDQLIEKKSWFLALADERWRSTLDSEIKGWVIGGRRTITKNNFFISELPEQWALTPLKHLVDPRRPVMYGIVLPGPDVDDGVLIVKGGDVKPGRLSPDSLCRTTREIEAGYARSRLRGGDLVIAIRGGIGDVEIIPPEIEGANLTQDAARIAPRRGVLNHSLRYALQAPSVFAPLAAGANGAAVRGINIFDLDRVLIPTPSEAEQISIAERLSAKEKEIWRMRHKITEHADLIRELRSALITAAVTGQIDVISWGKQGSMDRRLDAIQETLV
jgi:type I restriction enzyme S subunit